MKCRKLAKMIPQLAADELDKSLAQAAKEHLRQCPACAEEYLKCTEAQQALSTLRDRLPVPEVLDVLRYPESISRRRAWLVPAVAGAVVLIAIVALLPRVLLKPYENVARTAPPVKQAVRVAPKPAPEKIAEVRQPEAVKVLTSLPARPRHKLVKAKSGSMPRPPTERPSTQTIAKQTGPADNNSPNATPPVEPSSIEVTSTDHATGRVTIYKAGQNAAGGENIQVTQFIADDGGL